MVALDLVVLIAVNFFFQGTVILMVGALAINRVGRM
jgi:hypothetical protein